MKYTSCRIGETAINTNNPKHVAAAVPFESSGHFMPPVIRIVGYSYNKVFHIKYQAQGRPWACSVTSRDWGLSANDFANTPRIFAHVLEVDIDHFAF